ncbi:MULTISPECIES: multidrug ABC transporter ATPase [unclassified Microbacterium]|uniref:multidrug ABC transporter ATPase n=1 Tax=unclassified Microbacterium TaxID=2609290 RepID=UPI001AC1EB5C|nr:MULTISPECIES: multidrug ABC transporter ATPase [unclassified Microbacterium]MBN9157462.1 multidrug ABC transporter ATPase [Microbacterium sp.]MBS1897097.1 multidrug ABC transporter ATPase [Actinomycetota bacterium]
MSTRPPAPEPEIRPIDRYLTFGALTLAALSVVCFFAIIIGTAVGMKQADFAHGAWPVVGVFPFWGLPIAFVMIIALLIMSSVRRGRAARRS